MIKITKRLSATLLAIVFVVVSAGTTFALDLGADGYYTVHNEAELKEAVALGGKIKLGADITVDNFEFPAKHVEIDGQNKYNLTATQTDKNTLTTWGAMFCRYDSDDTSIAFKNIPNILVEGARRGLDFSCVTTIENCNLKFNNIEEHAVCITNYNNFVSFTMKNSKMTATNIGNDTHQSVAVGIDSYVDISNSEIYVNNTPAGIDFRRGTVTDSKLTVEKHKNSGISNGFLYDHSPDMTYTNCEINIGSDTANNPTGHYSLSSNTDRFTTTFNNCTVKIKNPYSPLYFANSVAINNSTFDVVLDKASSGWNNAFQVANNLTVSGQKSVINITAGENVKNSALQVGGDMTIDSVAHFDFVHKKDNGKALDLGGKLTVKDNDFAVYKFADLENPVHAFKNASFQYENTAYSNMSASDIKTAGDLAQYARITMAAPQKENDPGKEDSGEKTKNDKTEQDDETETITSPDTGDNTPVALLLFFTLTAVGVLSFLFFKKLKKADR